mgnify:CR=1 FL=1
MLSNQTTQILTYIRGKECLLQSVDHALRIKPAAGQGIYDGIGQHPVHGVGIDANIPDDAAKWRIELFGDQGRLIGDTVIGQVDGGSLDAMFLGEQGAYDAQQDKKDGERSAIEVEFGNMYAREVASFSNSILTGAPLEVPAEEAVQVQRVMEAAYRSNDEKTTITL